MATRLYLIRTVIMLIPVAALACKTRTPKRAQSSNTASPSPSHTDQAQSNGDQTRNPASGSLALFGDWYQKHIDGENSAAKNFSDAVIAAAPSMKDNAEFAQGEARIGGGGGPRRPEDSNLPPPTTPFEKTCLGPGGEAFERIQPLFCAIVPVPNKTDIIDKQAAIRLGKALFWDTQVGGDGQTACASCHFSGGADNRMVNTIHPGPNGIFEAPGISGPGQSFSPFQNIASDDRVGSQGVTTAIFKNISQNLDESMDNCQAQSVSPFFVHRQVTGRNTPSVINAIFNQFNFWDGRANPVFNGYDPFGNSGNATNKQALSFNSSLASQSVGPANNSVEMSCSGRAFNGPNSLAAKMLARRPLKNQVVSPSDSALGEMSDFPNAGLNCWGRACTYRRMVRDAFGSDWENIAQDNFSRLWGQALQAYMSTLISDQSRFDQYIAGKKSLFTPKLVQGLDIFVGTGYCSDCHAGAELTDASVSYARLARREDQGNDEGFHNLGVSPTEDDLGRASLGPLGVPWAVSKSAFNRGAFKTPGLRNLKLTAPYFHNGVKATLEEAISFYAHRGGDFANPEMSDELQNISIEAPEQQAALVEFLRDGLLDCRVEKSRAPFDHPALPIPNGVNLPATGRYGLAGCRLSPSVPPTTANCIKNPGICDTDAQLFGTSVYMDLFGRLGSTVEVSALAK